MLSILVIMLFYFLFISLSNSHKFLVFVDPQPLAHGFYSALNPYFEKIKLEISFKSLWSHCYRHLHHCHHYQYNYHIRTAFTSSGDWSGAVSWFFQPLPLFELCPPGLKKEYIKHLSDLEYGISKRKDKFLTGTIIIFPFTCSFV